MSDKRKKFTFEIRQIDEGGWTISYHTMGIEEIREFAIANPEKIVFMGNIQDVAKRIESILFPEIMDKKD